MQRTYSHPLIIFTLLCFCPSTAKDFYLSNQQLHAEEDFADGNAGLYSPVTFSPSMIRIFFQHTFNHPHYPVVLANDFGHFLDFMSHDHKSHKSSMHLAKTMRLFGNKLKASEYVSAPALRSCIKVLYDILKEHCSNAREQRTTRTEKAIYDLMYHHFSTDFSSFKNAPELFLTNLSHLITAHVDSIPTQDDIGRAVTNFLSLSLNKMLWSVENPLESWNIVKEIAETLDSFRRERLLAGSEDYGDLLISLVERYCYFLDIANEYLPLEFYEQLQSELLQEGPTFLEEPEMHELLLGKKERLLHAVIRGRAQAQARKRSLVIGATKKGGPSCA